MMFARFIASQSTSRVKIIIAFYYWWNCISHYDETEVVPITPSQVSNSLDGFSCRRRHFDLIYSSRCCGDGVFS